ncbi:MAG: prepilin-type N-terminal cleavage/methylation domain-containing protein [bacterium]
MILINAERKGFTLAEVLSTLAVVGVLAGISIGIILPKIQDAQHRTAFKTEYSVLAQVTTRIAGDNGGSLKGVFTDNNTMKNKYKEYLNTIKSCDEDQTLGNCWHNNDGSTKTLNGTPFTGWNNTTGLILNNGVLLRLGINSPSCTALSGTVLFCGGIYVDVNGFKGPNTVGKDIYFIYIQENGINPRGTKDDGGYINTCTTSNTGWGCAAKVLMGQDY